MNEHILLVDDDNLMRRSLTFALERAGYKVSSASNAEDALQITRRDSPDLIVLDINLPGMDGLRALEHFREQASFPIVFLSARRRELDEIIGLELGADDYITKPVNLDVLLAHIKAVFRRTGTAKTPPEKKLPLAVGDISLDPVSHQVTVGDCEIFLSPKEFELLHTFVLNPGRVISTGELLSTVWGLEYYGQPQVVYVHIRWLRKKIESDPSNPLHIKTIHGVGYKFEPQGL